MNKEPSSCVERMLPSFPTPPFSNVESFGAIPLGLHLRPVRGMRARQRAVLQSLLSGVLLTACITKSIMKRRHYAAQMAPFLIWPQWNVLGKTIRISVLYTGCIKEAALLIRTLPATDAAVRWRSTRIYTHTVIRSHSMKCYEWAELAEIRTD